MKLAESGMGFFGAAKRWKRGANSCRSQERAAGRSNSHRIRLYGLRGLFAFDDGDIAIDGQVREPLLRAARLGPLDFKPVDFFRASDTKHFTHIVRRKIAAAIVFETRVLHSAG